MHAAGAHLARHAERSSDCSAVVLLVEGATAAAGHEVFIELHALEAVRDPLGEGRRGGRGDGARGHREGAELSRHVRDGHDGQLLTFLPAVVRGLRPVRIRGGVDRRRGTRGKAGCVARDCEDGSSEGENGEDGRTHDGLGSSSFAVCGKVWLAQRQV